MRVFLSHSSSDKTYVESVAKLLRPGTYEIDSTTFDKGELNSEAIIHALKRSSMFCLFISNSSVLSSFVDFEVMLATELMAGGGIKKILLICLDDDSFNYAKEHVKYFNIVRKAGGPETSARLIQGRQISLRSEQGFRGNPFIGREDELRELEDQITDLDRPVVKALFIAGNAGAGRRTIAKKIYQNIYPHVGTVFPQVDIDLFSGLDEIYQKLLVELNSVRAPSDFVEKVSHFMSLEATEKIETIAAELNNLLQNNEAVYLLDTGGMLREGGGFQSEFNSLLSKLQDRPHPPVIMISPRMIPRQQRRSENDIAYLSVGALTVSDTERLVVSVLKDARVTATKDDVSDLVQLADQHPFNVYRMIDDIKRIGTSAFLASTKEFINWKHKQTSEYLRGTNFSDLDIKILSILSIVPELDFQALSVSLNVTDEQISDTLQNLVDLHIIRASDDRFSISPALRVASDRDPRLSIDDIDRTALMKSLAEALQIRLEDGSAPISLINSTIFASLEGGKPLGKIASAFLLPSHSVWLAKRYYDDKHWHESIKFSKDAISGKGRLSKEGLAAACRYLCLAASRVGQQDDYNIGIAELASIASDNWALSNIQFLKGFNARLLGNLPLAESYLKESNMLNSGNRATARELASVSLLLGKPDEALDFARKAYDLASNNPYIIDILISALIRTLGRECKNNSEVQQLLDQLQELDNDEGRSFYTTRSAEIEYLYGDLRQAQILAKQAMNKTPQLFDPIYWYIKILLKGNDTIRAKDELNRIHRMVSNRKNYERNTNFRLYLEIKAQYLMEIKDFKGARDVYKDKLYFSDEDRLNHNKNVDLSMSFRRNV